MREKAQRVEELTIILVGTKLDNLYSRKCTPHPLKILREHILYVCYGLVVFFLNLLKFRFRNAFAGSYAFADLFYQPTILFAGTFFFLYLIEILEKILNQTEFLFFNQLVIKLTALQREIEEYASSGVFYDVIGHRAILVFFISVRLNLVCKTVALGIREIPNQTEINI